MSSSSQYLLTFSWILKPYKYRFIFGVFASISNKILDLMPPLLVAWVIDTIQGNAPKWIELFVPISKPWPVAIFLAALAIIIFLFESITQWIYQRKFHIIAQQVQHDLRCHTYSHLQEHDMEFFENQRLGQLIAVVNDDINQMETFLNSIFNDIVQLVVLCSFSLTIMAITSWQLALFSLIPVPIVIIGSFGYQRFISPYYQHIRHTVGELVARLENNLSGIGVIKSFTAEKYELNRVKKASNEYKSANISAIKIATIYVPVIRMVIAFGFSGVLLLGSYWVLSGSSIITIGELVLFSMMIQRLLWPLTRLGDMFDSYERANASAKRLLDLLSNEPKIRSPHHPINIKGTNVSIAFNDVNFHYKNSIPVLSNLNFSIPAGKTFGLAGTTGSGKSTIVKCLLRLYEVTNGSITLNNTDVRHLSLLNLRQNIALVSQDIYLFHGSIRQNIAYGIKHNISDEQLYHAANMAELHDFISSCPNGYDSIIGENGIKLSGGQRQRLSIARAILKNAPVMIFDEATSSVDTETERAIKYNISTLTEGKTALIIAHRLSTIRYADNILVLSSGSITESGTHDELIKLNGDYYDLWSLQIGNH